MLRRSALPWVAIPLAALCLAGCKRGAQGGFAPPPPVVEVITVEPETIRDTIILVGQLESEHSVELRPEIDGMVESIEFVEGQTVKKGDVLFGLRDSEQRAHAREATARAKLAEEIFRRISLLAAQEVSARVEFDRAQAELEVARAEAQLREVELEKTKVRAPFDGVVGLRLVSPGERVRRSTPLVKVDAVDRLQLVFAVPEIGVPFVRTGMPVTVTVKPFPEIRFAGEVFFVSPTLDATTRRLTLKAWVPNPGRKLQPGLFANLEVQLAERPNAVVVPDAAILVDQGGSFVWRIGADGKATRAPVEIGLRKAARVEIASGLEAGDRIVSAGTQKVTEGAAVVVAETDPAAAEVAEPGEPASGGKGGG
ncbi:MAG TPA: efflux RND transporter periplasmic adaptor subunit [Myxococcota bacterium]|nr:efflux RND transporter periplasmic adaptor subunit [Myxococcota bacterium]